ncbi:DUF4258 domain-containing protein [Flavobacterium sp. Sd200]|uniref:DUF4258 domain-containing protein n=1 Tax=Flavobacterium sp. Sd200 TaxID=2692211 RepID=UPI00136E0A3C|nr:DUF4258 domain-containing protein [Flavobacterium sp. Sd200]MXN90317.1 DUF4258 domain-containing protein [Flavobacterium sp. Sd200]
MQFKYRLAYYLFGFMIGGFFLYYILGAKGAEFCYLPNCRVLKNIRIKGLVISKEAQHTLKENWVTQKDVDNTLHYGSVDFSNSNKPEKGGKLYIIEGKTVNNEPINIEVINGDDKAILKNIKKK